MGSVSDCQANGNHQPPPPQAEAEQVVEEGDAGDTIKGNYQPPEPVAEAGQVVEEGDGGETIKGNYQPPEPVAEAGQVGEEGDAGVCNHQPPPPQAEAEQFVEEGDAGDMIKGNYQPPEPGAEAGQVVEEGDAGVSNHQPPTPQAEAEQVVEEGDAGDTIKGNYQPSEPVAEAGHVVEEGDADVSMEGVASIALLPTGSISGHFIRLPGSICYGLHGTPISCERECSRGEDYRLIKLTIIDFKSKREKVLVVECRGHDAARLQNIDHLHGWEEDIVGLVEKEHGNQKVLLSFECETLKADKDAEDHITKYMPNLCGLDAVVNIGKMSISGINLDEDDEERGDN